MTLQPEGQGGFHVTHTVTLRPEGQGGFHVIHTVTLQPEGQGGFHVIHTVTSPPSQPCPSHISFQFRNEWRTRSADHQNVNSLISYYQWETGLWLIRSPNYHRGKKQVTRDASGLAFWSVGADSERPDWRCWNLSSSVTKGRER